jgi:hypothetical protein
LIERKIDFAISRARTIAMYASRWIEIRWSGNEWDRTMVVWNTKRKDLENNPFDTVVAWVSPL